jgi:hypothetical protein
VSYVSRTWMAPSADGRLEVFVAGTSADLSSVTLWQLYQLTPAGGWSQWVSHGSPVTADGASWPIVGASADGRLELFMSFGGVPYQMWQTAANNGWTPTWTAVQGTPTDGVWWNAMAPRADRCLELFTVGDAFTEGSTVWHNRQSAPSNGWSGLASLGSPPISSTRALLTVGASADGRLEVFVSEYFGALWHIWQLPAGGWSNWTSHGSPPGIRLRGDKAPAIAADSEGRLELFAVGEDGALWHIWQTAPSGGWSGWTTHGTPPATNFIESGGPAVAASADGRLELFIPGADSQLWHINQLSPSGGWCQWYSHGAPPPTPAAPDLGLWGQTPAVALNSQGRLELFAIATDGSLCQIWQTAPNEGWSTWLTHGKPPGCTIFPFS